MDEAQVAELLARLEQLEQEKNRWKAIGIGAIVLLVLGLLLGGILGVGPFLYSQSRLAEVREEAERARVEAEMSHREAEMQRMRAEEALRQAQQELEKAKRAPNP
jgi:hypothetical protein